MKTIVLQLPDSVLLSEQELQELLLQKLAEKASVGQQPDSATVQVPAKDADEIRHLIGLYYAEKAANLVDKLWDENGWTAETMHAWVQEHMRTPYRRESAA
ncbi:hypothetical protein [Hymenobacter weizhouensis]|uniref:hypothetical protein n=1 Tax=Hymenobacter sp. YIM 151500-1 TaxID=2987689 RepID=UPI002227FABF|nr:hypothetical protein [Hymenobacter sp. YIM 151500-1]UYZ63368.1 hypothetical protein OIS53_00645 [Hymenobacter sp. YIM 151500-1]